MGKMEKGTLAGVLVTLLGLALVVMCLIPVTSVEEVINTSFTVNPGTEYGPPKVGTGYHTRILGKSVLRGNITVEGGGVYLIIYGYNAPSKGLSVIDRCSFAVDPADDLYAFVFDNTEGTNESLVKFRLEEVWTRPMAIGSPPLFITGLIGTFTLIAGLVTLAIARLRRGTIH